MNTANMSNAFEKCIPSNEGIANYGQKAGGAQSHSFIYLLSVDTFLLQGQSWIVETVYSAKPKMFTLLSFVEKV